MSALSGAQRWGLAALTAGGLVLRLLYQVDRPFVGDEVGTIGWIASGYRFLFTHFIDPWLSMPIYLMLERFLAQATGHNPWALVLPSLVASVATIPLVAALGLRLSSPRTALLAAFLAAVHPYLLLYSVIIRSYSLMVAFTLAALIGLLDWTRRPAWRSGGACAFWVALALLFNANAIYQMTFFAALFVHWALRHRSLVLSGQGVRVLGSLLVPMLSAAVGVGLAYAPVLDQMAAVGSNMTAEPPTSLAYVPALATLYFADQVSGQWSQLLPAVPALLLIACGLLTAARRGSRLPMLGWAVLLPLVTASVVGLSHWPVGYARTFLPILPLLLLLLAEGIVRLSERAPLALGLLLVAVIVGGWVPRLADLFERKADYPWNQVAAYLTREARFPDRFIAVDSAAFHLDRFFTPGPTGFTSPQDYLRLPRAPGGAYRVFYVGYQEGDDGPARTRPGQRLGKVEITIYAGDSRREILQELAEDVQRSLGDRIDPQLAEAYKVLFQLMEALERPSDARRYRGLFEACNRRTARSIYLPIQQRR